MSEKELTTISLQLSKDLLDRTKEYCKENEISVSALIRKLLLEVLK